MRIGKNDIDKKWIMLDTEKKQGLPFGTFALTWMKVLNACISDDKKEARKEMLKLIPKEEKFDDVLAMLQNRKADYEKYYYMLHNAIDIRKGADNKMLWAYYEYFKYLPWLIKNDVNIDEFLEDVKNKNDLDIAKGIQFKGFGVLEDGKAITIYEISNEDFLFSLDLWECLINKHPIENINKCVNCGDFFIFSNGKEKYCDDCRKKMNRIRYKQRASDPIQQKHHKIYNKLMVSGGDTQAFIDESNYYKAIVKGKVPDIEKKPGYKDIKTEKAYIKWLDEKMDSLRVYKKKD